MNSKSGGDQSDQFSMATFEHDDTVLNTDTMVEFSNRKSALTIRFNTPVLGHREAPAIAGKIFRVLVEHEGNVQSVVLDLRQVSGMSSMGLGLCVEIRNQAVKAGARCVLFGLSRHLREMFTMMRIDRLYTIAETAAELADAAA